MRGEGFCKLLGLKPQQAGKCPPRSSLPLGPAPCPSFRPNSQIDFSSLGGMRTLIADAAWVESAGQ